MTSLHDHTHKKHEKTMWLLVLGIILVASNLRAPLTSVSPIISLIKEDLHISNTLAGMITTLPLLAFALFSPIVAKLANRFGIERVIFMSLIFLTVGIIIRSISGISALYSRTVLLGLAIAVGNVLLPSLIKREFPEKIGFMTGVYSISMNLFGAIASGISIPIALGLGLGWAGALRVWAILSVISLIVWLPQVRKRTTATKKPAETNQPKVNLWKSKLAWQVTIYTGIQSTIFYVFVAWLPEILKQKGLSTHEAGYMLSIMLLALLPFTFIVPVIAGKLANQRILVIITAALLLGGSVGLLYGSIHLAVLWVVALGIGSAFSFSLSMMFFGLRTSNSEQAASLSGMAQSIGYLMAAFGPASFGFIHDQTGNWDIPLIMMIVASILLAIFGLGAGKKRTVSD